jgi:PTS system mannose-specific IIA component
VDKGSGVLILTDMFGGTPSTISFSFLQENRIEVVTGVNLPMLLKLSTYDHDMALGELAEFIKSYGQRNINIASEILRKGAKQDEEWKNEDS